MPMARDSSRTRSPERGRRQPRDATEAEAMAAHRAELAELVEQAAACSATALASAGPAYGCGVAPTVVLPQPAKGATIEDTQKTTGDGVLNLETRLFGSQCQACGRPFETPDPHATHCVECRPIVVHCDPHNADSVRLAHVVLDQIVRDRKVENEPMRLRDDAPPTIELQPRREYGAHCYHHGWRNGLAWGLVVSSAVWGTLWLCWQAGLLSW